MTANQHIKRYSDDLFDLWPPPAEMAGRLNETDIASIKSAMRGQPMCGPYPNSAQLKEWGLTCLEQYFVYDTYWSW